MVRWIHGSAAAGLPVPRAPTEPCFAPRNSLGLGEEEEGEQGTTSAVASEALLWREDVFREPMLAIIDCLAVVWACAGWLAMRWPTTGRVARGKARLLSLLLVPWELPAQTPNTAVPSQPIAASSKGADSQDQGLMNASACCFSQEAAADTGAVGVRHPAHRGSAPAAALL